MGTRPLTAAPHPVPLRLSGPARGSHRSRIEAGSPPDSRGQPDAAVSEPPSGARVRGRSAARGGPGAGTSWSWGCQAVLPPAAPGCGPDRGLSRYLDHVFWRTPGGGWGWETVQEPRSVQKVGGLQAGGGIASFTGFSFAN